MAYRVIDAGIAVKWVVSGEPFREQARQLLRDARLHGITLIGPPLLAYEVESVLQYRLHSRQATVAAVDASLAAFYATGVRFVAHPDMVYRAREIARQFHQERIYDSLYAALAELYNCEFWTADRSFFEAVAPGLVYVKYLPDYRGQG